MNGCSDGAWSEFGGSGFGCCPGRAERSRVIWHGHSQLWNMCNGGVESLIT